MRNQHGSSPRVRGKLFFVWLSSLSIGLIPACAGKTFPVLVVSFQAGAHPRVCGENLVVVCYWFGNVGSSPRVRGKHVVQLMMEWSRGLIPACAGKTCCMACLRMLGKAHPRVCGENALLHLI